MNDEKLFATDWQADQAVFDISDFINRLPEPSRSLCRDVIINGKSTTNVARKLNVTPKTVLRRIRKAIAPLAVQYDIAAAKQFLVQNNSHGQVEKHTRQENAENQDGRDG